MTWLQIPSRFLRDGDSSVLYHDAGSREIGDLQVWLGRDREVVGFQLSHARTAREPEFFAEWHAGRALRLGEVDSGEVAAGRRGFRMSPICRSSARPSGQIAKQLLDYFDRNSRVLEPQQREVVWKILTSGSGA